MQQNQLMTEKQQFWLKHLESCKSLGLSRKEYCRQHGLVPDQMSYFASIISRKKSSPVPLILPQSLSRRRHSLRPAWHRPGVQSQSMRFQKDLAAPY